MTVYISVEQVIELNKRLGGAVRDAQGAAAAADRPASGFGGHELYADIWSKAAALLHGIASTQNFMDGNKRTAWVSMLLFLRVNDVELRALPRIAREAFVLTVATGLFTVDQAAEWIKENRVRAKDRLDFAVLAQHATFDEDEPSTWNAIGVSMANLASGGFPNQQTVFLAFRIKWRLSDIGKDHDAWLQIVTTDGGPGPVAQLPGGNDCISVRVLPPMRTGHAHHVDGVMPFIGLKELPLVLYRPGSTRLVLRLDGDILASLPLTVAHLPNMDFLTV